jgi:bile acid-coenzyme A ligase
MAAHSYGSVLSQLAGEAPDRLALVCENERLSRGALDARANRLARSFAAMGVGAGDTVSLCLPNSAELVVAMFATWKLGAVPNPLSHRLPEPELAAILERAEPRLLLGGQTQGGGAPTCLPAGFEPEGGLSDAPLPECIAPSERALASGGSTGLPKLIIPKGQAAYDRNAPSAIFCARETMLVPGPLYHAAPFSACYQSLLGGRKVVLMRRFDPARFLELIETHRVDRTTLVPTMMLRVIRLPAALRSSRDVSSLEFVMSGGAPLPAWLMRAWIDWLGPDVMNEAFGPSERIGGTFINGREWLEHPGSVGRPIGKTRIKIVDDAGAELPAGEMGEIFMLPEGGPGSTYRYVGAESRLRDDGYESVGDMGYLDENGYLYLGDRRSDMILCGGRNVYPAEVEAAIDEHPAVRSSAVIGLPDEDLGERIHAIVETGEPIDSEALRDHLRERLVAYKLPRDIEWSEQPLRDDAGKLRRSRLRAARIAPGNS